MAIVEYNVKQGSDEWHELRRNHLTASNGKKLVTPKNRNISSAHINNCVKWLCKDESMYSTYSNDSMNHGHTTEPIARKHFSQKTGIEVRQTGFISRTSKKLDFKIGCSPDGFCSDGAGLEIKCPQYARFRKDSVSVGCPLDYFMQAQYSMLVTVLKSWHVYSYFQKPGDDSFNDSMHWVVYFDVEVHNLFVDALLQVDQIYKGMLNGSQ